MKKQIKGFLRRGVQEITEIIGIGALVTLIWRSLHLLFTKEFNLSVLDITIGLILIMILHMAYKRHFRPSELNDLRYRERELIKNKYIKFLKDYIEIVVEILGIAMLVTFIWQGLELLIIKRINPNMLDTIIAIPITIILHLLYKKYITPSNS